MFTFFIGYKLAVQLEVKFFILAVKDVEVTKGANNSGTFRSFQKAVFGEVKPSSSCVYSSL